VRDVDLDCTQLNIDDGKMEKSNEPRVIPKKLQPYVRQLVEGRDPFEPLLKTSYTESGHHTRRWLEALDTFCQKAGVPYFCPHTLKGVSGVSWRWFPEALEISPRQGLRACVRCSTTAFGEDAELMRALPSVERECSAPAAAPCSTASRGEISATL